MKVEVLVATMNQTDYSLIDKMNIQTDAIIGNQCNRNSIEEIKWKKNNIKYLNFNEKGVGLNRNNALMRATGDYCLFADDDMIYVDNYEEKVIKAFRDIPKADIIIFNLIEKEKKRKIIDKTVRIHWYNYLKFGTVRIAVKLSSIRKKGIYFNQCFGGGTEHSHGEDNLFLTSCLKNKLKIYAVPEFIGELTESRESTWNKGYDMKYIKDQGVLYKTISPKWWKILCLQDAFRHRKKYNRNFLVTYKKMTKEN